MGRDYPLQGCHGAAGPLRYTENPSFNCAVSAPVHTMQLPSKRSILLYSLGALAGAALLLAAYVWVALSWSYSSGERAGYLQKMSHKGWLCKTWEGELLLVAMPGTTPEKFLFTVRDDEVASAVNAAMGTRVALLYEQNIGLPGSCFGDTQYFISGVKDAP